MLSATRAARVLNTLAVAVMICSLTGTVWGATASFSATAPTLGSNDISNLTGASDVTNNVSRGDPNATYLANDRPVQGQTFTTGSGTGYQLTAVTLKQVAYSTFALVPNLTYTIRVTRPSGGSALSVLASETASVPDNTPGNFPTISGGGSRGPGSGRYVTFTLANPVALSANTTYGFDVGAGTSTHYWETDGTSNTVAYAGGTAYSSAPNGVGGTTRTDRAGDHVFVLALIAANAPVFSDPTISPSNNVYAGTPATLSVNAAGSAPLRYQWQTFDGIDHVNISGATNSSYVVTTTGLLGDYAYDVVVTNSFGAMTSAPVTLTVQAASIPFVAMDTTPPSATRYVGQEVSFGAAFDGTLPIAYQWQKLGADISGATNATLTLTNLQLSDDDNYWLFASNSVGTASSTPAILTMLAAPSPPAAGTFPHAVRTNNPIAYWRLNDPADTPFLHDSAGSHNAKNSSVTLGVPGLQSPTYPGFPPDNTAASFGGNSVATAEASLMNGLANFTLLGWFNPAAAHSSSAALFGQNAVCEVGYSDSAGVNLVIQLTGIWVNPRTGTNGFTPGQWYFVAVVGDGSSLDIYVNGALRAHQTGGASSATSSFGFNIGGAFDNFPAHFNGQIEDVAIFNKALSPQRIQELYDLAAGLGAPSILGQPISQALYVGRTARFSASGIGGTPPLGYRWQHAETNISNGSKISGATTPSLTISNVAATDAGAYRLVVTNAGGATTSSVVTLTVVQPTGTPYESVVLMLNPIAYWRLNETNNTFTGTVLAHDYFGGLAGLYGSAAVNGVPGPRPLNGFTAFETNNVALFPGAGTEDSWVTVPALNLNTHTASFTMWILPYGGQSDYAGLFMTRSSGTIAGVGYGGSLSENASELVYTWNDNTTWTFKSGLTIPNFGGYWSFVAVVIDSSKATLYLYNTNGLRSATNAIAHTTEGWGGSARIGGDPHGVERTFTGTIDEVAVFNYALTPEQVLSLYNGQSAIRLNVQRSGPNLILSWSQGTLQQANSVTGSWSNVSGAVPPSFSTTPTGTQKFYRVRVNP